MAWYMLGQSLEQESEPVKAEAAWRNAIAIDPNFTRRCSALRARYDLPIKRNRSG